MSILGLLNLWLGRALVSRGLGAPTGNAPPVVARPKVVALLYAVPVADAALSTTPLAGVLLTAVPVADVGISTAPLTATLPG